MQGQWLLVLGPYLLIHLSLTSNHLKGDMWSEGVPSDIGSLEGALCESMQIPPHNANSDVFPYLSSSGIEYNPRVFEQDRLPTYTDLDDYDTLFEARHGRGAIRQYA